MDTAEEKTRRDLHREAFERAVEMAKKLVKDIRICQLEIARLATCVCVKGTGGFTRSDVFTYTKFAEAIGIHRKTLLEWVAVYDYAKENLPKPPGGSYSPEDYKKARWALSNDRLARRHGLIKGDHISKRIHRTKSKNEREKRVDFYSCIFLRYASRMKKQLISQGSKDIPIGVKAELKSILAELYKLLDEK